jgi:hypothetical protein
VKKPKGARRCEDCAHWSQHFSECNKKHRPKFYVAELNADFGFYRRCLDFARRVGNIGANAKRRGA